MAATAKRSASAPPVSHERDAERLGTGDADGAPFEGLEVGRVGGPDVPGWRGSCMFMTGSLVR
jgi:hypothetical protein